jgi:hypothetical protein
MSNTNIFFVQQSVCSNDLLPSAFRMDSVSEKENMECITKNQINSAGSTATSILDYIKEKQLDGLNENSAQASAIKNNGQDVAIEKSLIRKSFSSGILTCTDSSSILPENHSNSSSHSLESSKGFNASKENQLEHCSVHEFHGKLSPLRSSVLLAYLATLSLPKSSPHEMSTIHIEKVLNSLTSCKCHQNNCLEERELNGYDDICHQMSSQFPPIAHNIQWEEHKHATIKSGLLARLLDINSNIIDAGKSEEMKGKLSSQTSVPASSCSSASSPLQTSRPMRFLSSQESTSASPNVAQPISEKKDETGCSKRRRLYLSDIDRDLNATAPSSY